MSEQPTEAQIKEFWEWCGLHYTAPYWVDENNALAFYGEVYSELLKSIDLDNLFKYPVPKYLEKYGKSKLYTLLDYWLWRIIVYSEDPALALFWALWQVKESSG